MRKLSLATSLAVLLAGCATTGEPDTADAVAGAAGSLAKGLTRTVMALTPGMTEATEALDAAIKRYNDSKASRAEAADAETLREMIFLFCTANPCVGTCPGFLEDTLGILPECPSRGGESGETFLGSRVEERMARGHSGEYLRARLKFEEGYVAMVTNGHICHGHVVQPGERIPHVVDEEFCERLLTADIEAARGRAMVNLGRTDDAAVELCYWRGCNQWPDGDPAAIRSHLRSIGNARALRLLRDLAIAR